MKISRPTLIAFLTAAVLALAGPADARPIDADRPPPSVAPTSSPAPSGPDPWVVPLAAVLAFAAGAGAATLAPVIRLRVRAS